MVGDVSGAGGACRRYATMMTRAVHGESSPEGTVDHRQGWSEAQPLLNDTKEAKPRRGDRQDEPSGVQRVCFLSVAPSGLHRSLHPEQGFRFAPPLPVVRRPFGACCVSATLRPEHDHGAPQTRPRRTPNSATAHLRLCYCAEQNQNIIDIFRITIEISTNSIDIFRNFNDILSFFGTLSDDELRFRWVGCTDELTANKRQSFAKFTLKNINKGMLFAFFLRKSRFLS